MPLDISFIPSYNDKMNFRKYFSEINKIRFTLIHSSENLMEMLHNLPNFWNMKTHQFFPQMTALDILV